MRTNSHVHQWKAVRCVRAKTASGRLLLAAALAMSMVAAQAVYAQENGPFSDTVFINGQPVAPFPLVESTNVSQFVPAFFPANGIPNIAVVFYEDASQSVVSDQLWVQNQQFYFASDPDLVNLQTLGIPVVAFFVENGAPQDVSAPFGLPPGSVAVQSDVVPEPNTIVLLGISGLTLLACLRRPAKK